MSIVTEISRIKSAKSAIAAAIAGKGVTVPDGTLLDGMAALIDSIEAGGSSLQFVTGSFTIVTEPNSYGQYFYGGIGTVDDLGVTVEHGLGIIPKVGILVCETRFGMKEGIETVESALVYEDSDSYHQWLQPYYSSSASRFFTSQQPITLAKTSLTAGSIGCFLAATENDIFITGGSQNAGCSLKEGYTYRWLFAG